jgi:hypothetical protein
MKLGSMIKFKVINNKVILSYTRQFGPDWVYPGLDESGSVLISKAFRVTKNELISPDKMMR